MEHIKFGDLTSLAVLVLLNVFKTDLMMTNQLKIFACIILS
jgi:hypothetical protein